MIEFTSEEQQEIITAIQKYYNVVTFTDVYNAYVALLKHHVQQITDWLTKNCKEPDTYIDMLNKTNVGDDLQLAEFQRAVIAACGDDINTRIFAFMSYVTGVMNSYTDINRVSNYLIYQFGDETREEVKKAFETQNQAGISKCLSESLMKEFKWIFDRLDDGVNIGK